MLCPRALASVVRRQTRWAIHSAVERAEEAVAAAALPGSPPPAAFSRLPSSASPLALAGEKLGLKLPPTKEAVGDRGGGESLGLGVASSGKRDASCSSWGKLGVLASA